MASLGLCIKIQSSIIQLPMSFFHNTPASFCTQHGLALVMKRNCVCKAPSSEVRRYTINYTGDRRKTKNGFICKAVECYSGHMDFITAPPPEPLKQHKRSHLN